MEYHYFCHGLTFNGGGPLSLSPTGNSVPAILGLYYTPIAGKDALAGDIIVGYNGAGQVDHSCILTNIKLNANGTLDANNTMVKTKNGNAPEAQMTLAAMKAVYNLTPTWIVYTRK